MLLELTGKTSLRGVYDQNDTAEDTNHDTNEWQSSNTLRLPAAHFGEGNRVGLKE